MNALTDRSSIKGEPGISIATAIKQEPGARAAKARRLEELKQQLQAEQEEYESMKPDMKQEPFKPDNAFYDLVEAFSKETATAPMSIEDSP